MDEYTFKHCSNGHYYQEDECPYCKAKESELKIKKAIKMMIDNEKNSDQVREYLINICAFDIESADSLISDISNWCKQYEEANRSANRNIAFGLLWFIGGLLVTAITYSAVANGGGRYIVTWGAIIFGLLQFIGGLVSNFGSFIQKIN